MPIYEYRCDNGHTFETFQSISDDPLTECTECGAPVQKVLSAPAIHFKGSGFYTTDYGSKSKSRSGGDSGGSDSGSGENGSGSSGSESGSGGSDSSGSSGDSKSSGDTAKSAA